MGRGTRIAIFALGFVVLALGLIAAQAYVQLNRPGPLTAERTVVIPRGTSVVGIARMLNEADIIDGAYAFRVAAKLEADDEPLRAGEYRFPAHASVRQVLAMMREGEVVRRKLTVPEGLTSQEVLTLVAGAEGLEGPLPPVPAEGTLLPETYTYTWGDTRVAMVDHMAAAMVQALAQLWATRAADLPIASPHDAVILASIVEKETAQPEERPRIAAVYINRLRIGMKLQADPTVAYAVRGPDRQNRPLSLADLQVDSPYNTYIAVGLPPGPIANPGRRSLQAVLRPTLTEELYFVADGSGGHAFARTYDEHQRNVAKWRRLNAQP